MVQPIPGSLSEGAVERSETEGVYCDERKRSKVSEPIKNCEETTSPVEPSDDTPSVTPIRACQLPQRGSRGNVPTMSITRPLTKHQRAGDFLWVLCGVMFCHSTGCLRNRGVTGDFHRPYETQKILGFTIQRRTLPQSASLTAPSEREPGMACTIHRGTR